MSRWNVLEDNGKTTIWVDTTTCSVQVEFADRDTHTSDTKVAQAEDSRAISDDNDLGIDLTLSNVG